MRAHPADQLATGDARRDHRAIEECEERLTEEDTLALLELIDRTLPKPPPRAGQAAEDPEESQDEPQDEAMES